MRTFLPVDVGKMKFNGHDPLFKKSKKIKELEMKSYLFKVNKLFVPFIFWFSSIISTFAQTEIVSTIPSWDGSSIVYVCLDGTVVVQIQNSTSGNTYRIRKTAPLPAVTIQEIMGTGGTILSNPINIFGTIGSFTISVRDLADDDPDLTFTVNVSADPTAPSLALSHPESTVNAGTMISATAGTAGTGGVAGSADDYEYSIDGGTTWLPYILGSDIGTTNYLMPSVKIKAFRVHPDGLGCYAENIYTWTVDSRVHDITGTQGSYYHIQQAIDAASTVDGDVLVIEAGTIALPSSVNINKEITLKGQGIASTIIDLSSAWFNNPNYYGFSLNDQNITIEDIHFRIVGKGQGNILGLFQSNCTIQDNKFSGEYVYGDTEVTRATVWSASPITGILFDNNIIESLRQPGYLSNGSGTISNNTITTTRGWVIEGVGTLSFTGNTFGANTSHITILDLASNISGLTISNNDLSGAVVDWKIDNRATGVLDADCNWFGSASYASIFAGIKGKVAFVPYKASSGGSCNVGFALPMNLQLTHTPASENILVEFDVDENDLELRPIPNLNPAIPAELAQIVALYEGLETAIEGGNPVAIQNAALAVGDDIITEYYYMDGPTKVYLQTVGNNDLIKNKYWQEYLVNSGTPAIRYPKWATNLTLVPQTNLRTSTNPLTGSVAAGWLNPVLGRDLVVKVTFIHNGAVNSITQTIAIPAGPIKNLDTGLGYPTIQAAIDAMETIAGHTIEVDNGTYVGNLEIDKDITLKSKNLHGAVLQTQAGFNAGNGYGGITFLADGATLERFRIEQNVAQAIVHTRSANNVSILNNQIVGLANAPRGIDVGYASANSNGVIIDGNTFEDVYCGVYINQATNLNILSNTFNADMGDGGIVFDGTWPFSNITVNNNTANDIDYLMYLFGSSGSVNYAGNTLNSSELINAGVRNVNKSTPYLTIQSAIAGADSGDDITIRSGLYTENVTATATPVTLIPGNSPGCVTINGNYTLNNNITLEMEVDGITACTLYDQITVNGTVTLNGATLTIDLNYVPILGDNYTLIANDGTDPVVGLFAQGYSISQGGHVFQIDYAGGDGNDVVLTKCTGGVINTNTAKEFCSIQDAIDDPSTFDNHIITVAAGTYTENIVINGKNGLILNGPNYLLNNAKGTRSPEAIVVAASNAPVFTIEANVTSYTINGFNIVGADYIAASNGRLIWAKGTTTQSNILNNKLELTSNETANSKRFIWLGPATSGNSGANYISGNVKYNHFKAYGTGSRFNGLITQQSPLNLDISYNWFEDMKGQRNILVWHPSSTTYIRYNDLATTDYSDVIWLGGPGAQGGNAGAVIEDNKFSSDGIGVGIHSMNYNPVISGNSFADVTLLAIEVQSISGSGGTVNGTCNWFGTTNGNIIQTKVSNNVNFSPWLVPEAGGDTYSWSGMNEYECAGTPVVIASTSSTPNQYCQNDGTITVNFSGGSALYTVSWTGAASGGPVACTSGTPIGGFTNGSYSLTITDANGSSDVESVVVGNLPVRNTTTTMYYATIQAAIDAATANDEIDVCAGTYTETININKALTIEGPNAGTPGTGARAAEAVLLNCTIDINNAGNTTLDGLKVLRTDNGASPIDQIALDGGGTNTVQNCIFERNGSATTSLEIRALTTTTAGGNKVILNNKFTGDASSGLFSNHKTWQRGIYVDQGSFTVNISGNTIENCRTALNVDDYNNNLTIAGNTFNNNGTHISVGGALPSGSYVMGANNFINNPASTMVNLSNVAESFRLNITSSTLNGMSFAALTPAQLFDVEARMYHKESYSGRRGKVTYVAGNQYVNNFTVPVTKIDLINNSIKYADTPDTINLQAGTYNQKVIIDKSNLVLQGITTDKTQYILNGSTLVAPNSGITLNNGITGTTIQNLTVQNFTGTNGNSHAGIYGVGGNNSTTVTNVSLLNNPTASGFYANGPADDVEITNSMVSNNGGSARGIVIWNGLKTNITITGNMVTNNSCCGIELQDGDASGVTVSNNTIDVGSGDNAIGLTGLNLSTGANVVNNNTITGGGRFGIEIKNPAGGVTVSNNNVSLTTINADLRDRAGIAVFRRGVLGSNIDVPNGVTVTGNTVSGYTQTLPEEGFGIVIEGTNHSVTGNTINNCNIGIQEQGGAHANSYYPNLSGPDGPGNGDQGVGMSPNYFGRGNAPFACGNTIGSNTFSGNGTDTRTVVMNSHGLVSNITSGEYFCNIPAAINDAQTLNGHTITVAAGTYPVPTSSTILVNKSLSLRGANFGVCANGTRSPESKIVVNHSSGFAMTIRSGNVTVDGFEFETQLGRDAINVNTPYVASSLSTMSDFNFSNNIFRSSTTAANKNGIVFGENNLNGNQPSPNDQALNENVTIQCNRFDYTAFANTNRGIVMTTHFDMHTYNNFNISNNEFLLGPNGTGIAGTAVPNRHTMTGFDISDNAFSGGLTGLDLTKVVTPNIENNTFATFSFKAIGVGSSNGGVVRGNTINGASAALLSGSSYFGYGIDLYGGTDFGTPANGPTGNNEGLIVENNVLSNFTHPTETAQNFRAVNIRNNPGIGLEIINNAVDNVQNGVLIASAAANTIDINENSFTNAIAAIRNNSAGMTVAGTCNWHGTTSANVVASKNIGNVTFTPYLVDGTDNNIPAIGFQPVPGACTGTPVVITNVTTTPVLCGPTVGNMSVTFSGGTGPYTIAWSGAAMGGPVAATSVHTITPLPAGSYTVVVTDINGSTGTQTVTIDYLPVTNTSDMPNTHYATIQAAIDAATTTNGEILEVCAGTYTEDVVVTKSLDIRGPNYGVNPNTGTRTAEAVLMPASSGSFRIVSLSADNVSIEGFYFQGDNPNLTSNILGTNGADLDSRRGIGNTAGVNNLKVEKNIFQNLSYFAVALQSTTGLSPAVSTGHAIHNNRFLDLGTYTPDGGFENFGGGVLLQNSHYASINDNVMLNVGLGVQTGNFQVSHSGSAAFGIQNNQIQARRRGIFFNLHSGAFTPWTVSDNTITGIDNSNVTAWDGILIASQITNVLPSSFTNNTIDGAAIIGKPTEGYEIWNVREGSAPNISGGSVSNVDIGIFLNNYEGYSSDAGDGSHAAISGLTITPNATGVGIRLLDSPSSTAHAKVNATVTGVTISGGAEGIKLEQTNMAGAAVGGSFTNNTISASAAGINVARSTQSATNTLTIDNNNIDLTGQETGGNPTVGILLADITGSDNAIITDNDVTNAFYGYIGYNINTTPVTTISGGSISGVMQGTAFFNTLGGPLVGSTTGVSGVTMDGFTGMSGNPANNFHAGVYTFTAGGTTAPTSINLTIDDVTIDGTEAPSQASGGVYLADFSGGGTNVQNVTLTNSTIINNDNRGVDARGKVNLTMTGNTLTNNGNAAWGLGGNLGFSVIAQQNATITANNNFITLPATSSTEVFGLFTGNGTTNLITAEENSILLNGNADPDSRLAQSINTTGTINAECNWWGTANYQDIQALTNGNVDFINWLIDGTDTDGAPGFQPNPLACTGAPIEVTVTTNTPATCFTGNNGALVISVSGGTPGFMYAWSNGAVTQNINTLVPGLYTVTVTDSFGSTGTASATVGLLPVENVNTQTGYSTIQAAIAAAMPDHVIEVCAGTYTENININKALTINGPNEGISGTGTRFAEAVLLNSTIDINNSGTTIIDGFHVLRTDSTALDQIIMDGAGTNTVQNCIFERNDLMSIVPGEFARAITTSAGGGTKNVVNNLFTGNGVNLFGSHRTWNNAIYVNSGSASVNITGNTLMNARTAVNLDDYNANVNVSMNAFNNNGTHISFGGTSATTGNHTLGANDFNIAGSAIINLSNVTTAFRLDMTSSTWIGTSFGTLPNATLFAIEAGMYHRGRGGRNGLVTYKANNQYVIAVNPSLQLANDYAPVGGIVNIDAATFNQKMQITKSLTVQGGTNDKTVHIIDGTSVVGNTRGIEIATGVTNVTIQNLTVQNFAGTDGNTHGGIYAVGPNNNNLTVNSCLIQNNGAGSGFYANGPIDNLAVTYNMVNNHGNGARGIVVWNGMKTNINISNNMLINNRCCGIELQDGAASGVNVSYNTIDIGAGDNAIGLTGLDNSIGANTVNNNTITGGGRFGIEIKNPNGGVTVNANSVSLTTQDGDVRDRAGIVVMRRGVLNPPNIVNANVPDGVTVTNNTVSDYRQTNGGSSSTGFGIVIEGTNHVVTNNTLNNNDVALQLQAGHTPYAAPPVSVDGDQANLADLYFGRGNSPELCNVVHSPNTFTGNTVNSVRIVTGGGTGTVQSDITPTVNDPADQTVCVDLNTALVNFTGNYMVGVTYNWVNDNTDIGLAASGSGNIAPFTALNTTNAPIVANITVTPVASGCTGSPQTFTITVQPRPVIQGTVTSTNGYNQVMVSGGSYAHTTCDDQDVTTSIPNLTSTLANACGTLRIQTQIISTLPNIMSQTVDMTYAQAILLGPTTISPQNFTGSVQTITFLTTPYYDVNGNNMYDAGDVEGAVTTFVLTVQPKPVISNTVTSGMYSQVMTSGNNYAHAICHNTDITTSVPTLTSTLADACGTLRIRTQYISTLPNIPSATLDNTFANVVLAGPQTISPENNTGLTQTITFITTPYYDVNGNNMYDAGIDVDGEVTTFVLTVHPIPSGAISGSGFVVQNAPTTLNVTFTGSVGTAPYTFTYNVNGGGTQTITTLGMNDAITLPHPNGTPGTFTYTLLSVTDANGCAGVVDPLQDTVVIVVVDANTLPDLAPSIARPLNASFTNGQLKEGYVQFTNGGNGPTFGVTKVRLPKTVANFNLVIDSTLSSITISMVNVPVVNDLCTFADMGFVWEITYPNSIPMGSNIKIGYTLTATGLTGSNGTMTATVVNGTGGDSNNSNNSATRRFVIN